jgi:3'-phosphoadenosine 5'-phosphosulfate sulfotransferase (PAPS reductase)/FAD synthetase
MTFITRNENSVYLVNIGSNQIPLTACLAMFFGLIAAIATVIYIPNSIQAACIMILIAVVCSYELYCMELGKCDIFAWVVTISYAIQSILLIYLIYKNKSNPISVDEILKNLQTIELSPFASKKMPSVSVKNV